MYDVFSPRSFLGKLRICFSRDYRTPRREVSPGGRDGISRVDVKGKGRMPESSLFVYRSWPRREFKHETRERRKSLWYREKMQKTGRKLGGRKLINSEETKLI